MERIILKSIDFLQESTIIEVLSLYSKVHFQTSKYFSMTQNSRSKFNFPIFQRIKDEQRGKIILCHNFMSYFYIKPLKQAHHHHNNNNESSSSSSSWWWWTGEAQ